MGRFRLISLLACAKYERLTSEDYLRLGLCLPHQCKDCNEGLGHYVKNDKVPDNTKKNNKNKINSMNNVTSNSNPVLNNQLGCTKSGERSSSECPVHLVDNLHLSRREKNRATVDPACNRCKAAGNYGREEMVAASGSNSAAAQSRGPEVARTGGHRGCVNPAFIDPGLECEPMWYQPSLPRAVAVQILSAASVPAGAFVVRNSQTHAGSLALSVRVDETATSAGGDNLQILHYLILVTPDGFQIKGFGKVFPSLSGLVVHHTVMKESLPCRLVIDDADGVAGGGDERRMGGGGGGSTGGSSNGDSDRESDFADLDSDPEYPELLTKLRQQFSA